jgi:hypothetical protein
MTLVAPTTGRTSGSLSLGSRARWGRDGDLRQVGQRILVVQLWLGTMVLAAFATWAYTMGPSYLGVDAHAYWVGAQMSHPYTLPPGEIDAVLYSPVFLEAVRVLEFLPWKVFLAGLMLADCVAFWWLSAPLPWKWRAPALAACWPAVLLANVNPLLCVSTVLAITGAGAWSVVPSLLTKITPALMPLAWWASDKDWRRVARATAMATVLVAISWRLDPSLWRQWIAFLFAHSDDSTVRTLRLILAAGLAGWAAKSRRLWVAGLAFYLLLPMAGWHVHSLAGLMVLPRLIRADRLTRAPQPDS